MKSSFQPISETQPPESAEAQKTEVLKQFDELVASTTSTVNKLKTLAQGYGAKVLDATTTLSTESRLSSSTQDYTKTEAKFILELVDSEMKLIPDKLRAAGYTGVASLPAGLAGVRLGLESVLSRDFTDDEELFNALRAVHKVADDLSSSTLSATEVALFSPVLDRELFKQIEDFRAKADVARARPGLGDAEIYKDSAAAVLQEGLWKLREHAPEIVRKWFKETQQLLDDARFMSSLERTLHSVIKIKKAKYDNNAQVQSEADSN